MYQNNNFENITKIANDWNRESIKYCRSVNDNSNSKTAEKKENSNEKNFMKELKNLSSKKNIPGTKKTKGKKTHTNIQAKQVKLKNQSFKNITEDNDNLSIPEYLQTKLTPEIKKPKNLGDHENPDIIPLHAKEIINLQNYQTRANQEIPNIPDNAINKEFKTAQENSNIYDEGNIINIDKYQNKNKFKLNESTDNNKSPEENSLKSSENYPDNIMQFPIDNPQDFTNDNPQDFTSDNPQDFTSDNTLEFKKDNSNKDQETRNDEILSLQDEGGQHSEIISKTKLDNSLYNKNHSDITQDSEINTNEYSGQSHIDSTVKTTHTDDNQFKENIALQKSVFSQTKTSLIECIKNGTNSFDFQLNPKDLGTIKLSIDFLPNKSLKISIETTSINATEALKQEASHIENTVKELGFELNNGSLNFSFKDQTKEQNVFTKERSGNYQQDKTPDNNMQYKSRQYLNVINNSNVDILI